MLLTETTPWDKKINKNEQLNCTVASLSGFYLILTPNISAFREFLIILFSIRPLDSGIILCPRHFWINHAPKRFAEALVWQDVMQIFIHMEKMGINTVCGLHRKALKTKLLISIAIILFIANQLS